ncbi:MAG TPA: protocatechuate 3,4-dioxygenase subunit alpha [Terriglobales bacterium]|nr:protocatechuate 3,4-dioxygenase subunit alpha [Terriglobales bacterium]
MSLQATTSQTVGPYFQIGCRWLNCENLVGEGVTGERVTVRGFVVDGDGVGVPDALVEVWQANAHGKYAHPEDTQDKPLEAGFRGYGRMATDARGGFQLTTIKPGPVPGPEGREQAPHLLISVFMRGLLRRLTTRMYFPNDSRNATDSILNLVEPERRSTLIAKTGGASGTLEWNVILQGIHETVFFDLGL